MKKTWQDSVKVPLIGAFSSEKRSYPHALALSRAFNPENTFPNIPASLINEPRQLFVQATSLSLIAENEHLQITAALFLSGYAGPCIRTVQYNAVLVSDWVQAGVALTLISGLLIAVKRG
ncbi:hypothetical protein [Pantoea ananatis]